MMLQLYQQCQKKSVEFIQGRESTLDDTRSGHVITATNQENTDCVYMMMHDKYLTINQSTEVYPFTAENILRNKLKMIRASAH